MDVLKIDEKWSVKFDPTNNDRPTHWLRHGEDMGPFGVEHNGVHAMFYALKERADLAPAAAPVRVRNLEWVDFPDRGAKAQAWNEANYMIQKWSDGRWEISASYPGYSTFLYGTDRFYPTLEAAKAAAQADYEARILAALEPHVNETPKSEHDAGNVLSADLALDAAPVLAEAGKVLEGVTEGPWRVDGEPWNQIVWSSADNRVCFMSHSNGLDDERDIATARFIAWCREGVPALIALATAQAARIEGLQRTHDELYADALADAKSDAQEFDSDLWAMVRAYLDELHFDWRDFMEDGVTADEAMSHIRECMNEETRRAEAAEPAPALMAELVEALELADAALSGANMDMKNVWRKIKSALANAKLGGKANG